LQRWLPRKRRTLPAVVDRRVVTEGGVVALVVEVKDLLSNKPIKLTVRSVTQLACASCAPARPAAYRRRWTDKN
jgi:hypothetical protein